MRAVELVRWRVGPGLHGSLPRIFTIRPSPLRESAKSYKEFIKDNHTVNGERYDPAMDALIPERVMVCVSSAADAPRVIRAGGRLAKSLGARWYAVYVQTPTEAPTQIRPKDLEALERNLALAEELGATIVRVTADRTADGLIAFANREGITHVVFGQTARSRWEILVKGSTLNLFLEEVRDAAVQVVPLGESAA